MLEGYEFDSWSGDFTTETFNMPANNAIMTANAKPISYAITYNGVENCTFTTANPASYNIETADFSLNDPAKGGYEFIGWTYEGQTTPNKTVTINNGSIGAKEYTANWNLLLTIAIASDTGSVFEPLENNLYKFRPTFTITPTVADGIVLTNEEKTNIINAISVKDSNSTALNSISKSWENGNIALSFSEDLNASSTYTISCGDIDGITLTCTPLSFTTICFSGSGTSEAPFLVATAEQLDMVRKYLGCHFKQTATIDIGEYNWVPIGNYSNQFTGSYNGNANRIKNLTITSSEEISDTGLFGYIGEGGKVENLIVDHFLIRGSSEDNPLNSQCAGVIVGFNQGEIASCTVTDSSANGGSMIFVQNSFGVVGGICGNNEKYNEISSCHVEKCIIKGYGTCCRVGGICGGTYNNITSSYVNNVTFEIKDENSAIGGICGWASRGTINSCYVINSTFKNGTGRCYVGGICGNHSDYSDQDIVKLIYSCYVYNTNFESITGETLFGSITGSIGTDGPNPEYTRVTDCFYNGTGDFIGRKYGTSYNCYGGVTDFSTFKAKTWSDDKTYEGGSTAWNAYDFSNWPPKLKWETQASQP
ncbi:MAG: hypothetical protein II961_08585 [Candidatus Riflebacteria bacterium]|nr:hypothetical protein [Candidatus Riflebacteria bacterium]